VAKNPCRRGEVWVVNFNPGRGSEQKGVRPALVLQNDVGNVHAATTIVAAITTTRKKFPVTVLLGADEGGLKEPSMVNLAHVLTIDKTRLQKRLGSLSADRMGEVDEAARVSLGLED
jgi:mRNA interferase MazF